MIHYPQRNWFALWQYFRAQTNVYTSLKQESLTGTRVASFASELICQPAFFLRGYVDEFIAFIFTIDTWKTFFFTENNW